VIEVPFTRIAMDIVGPLERTQGGYKYILVICDYATRYPEAFPLRRVTARPIAQALLQLFSRVGIPKEIITDQGTAFLSTTLNTHTHTHSPVCRSLPIPCTQLHGMGS